VLNFARILGLSVLLPMVIVSCKSMSEGGAPAKTSGPVAVNDARLLKGTDDPHQWSHYGGSYNEQRFSPLKQINSQNIKDLGLAWYADYDTNQNQHGSPL
jgi:glucose dehydrogenase